MFQLTTFSHVGMISCLSGLKQYTNKQRIKGHAQGHNTVPSVIKSRNSHLSIPSLTLTKIHIQMYFCFFSGELGGVGCGGSFILTAKDPGVSHCGVARGRQSKIVEDQG